MRGINVAEDTPSFCALVIMILIHKKKTWEFYLLLVPRSKALASPISQKRATPKPTPVCIYDQIA